MSSYHCALDDGAIELVYRHLTLELSELCQTTLAAGFAPTYLIHVYQHHQRGSSTPKRMNNDLPQAKSTNPSKGVAFRRPLPHKATQTEGNLGTCRRRPRVRPGPNPMHRPF